MVYAVDFHLGTDSVSDGAYLVDADTGAVSGRGFLAGGGGVQDAQGGVHAFGYRVGHVVDEADVYCEVGIRELVFVLRAAICIDTVLDV